MIITYFSYIDSNIIMYFVNIKIKWAKDNFGDGPYEKEIGNLEFLRLSWMSQQHMVNGVFFQGGDFPSTSIIEWKCVKHILV